MTSHLVARATAVLLLLLAGRPLPAQTATGQTAIRIWGHGALGHDYIESLVIKWEAGFRKTHPEIQFDNELHGTASALGSLYTGTGDIAIMGREIWPVEVEAFKDVHHYPPLGIDIVTGSLDIRNNVVYNWLARTTDGGVQRCNYESNYYKPYPANNPVTWLLKLDAINTNWGTEVYYMAGNVMQGTSYYTNNWMAGSFYNGLPMTGVTATNAEVFPSYVTTQTASNAYEVVLSDVGCNLSAPDLIDQRIIGEVLDGTTHYEGTNGPNYTLNGVLQDDRGPDNPGFIDSQTDVHDCSPVPGAANYSPNYPWPAYATYNVPIDSDHDGMPDWWELIIGTNPNSAPGDYSDSNADPDGDGYSNLENYLNWLAAPHVDGTRNTNTDVDLTQFTRGFTNNSPTYAVFNPTNGTVYLLSGGRVARFTPTANLYGLGSFQFKVTDKAGFAYTNSVGIHIRALAQSQLGFTVTNHAPKLSFSGESGLYYLLQYSSDLINWNTWTNTTATTSAQSFTPPGFPSPQTRFYRAVSVQ